MEINSAAARHSWARQHAWVQLSFFPFPVGQTIYAHCNLHSLYLSLSQFHSWFRLVLSRALRSEIRVRARAASFSLLQKECMLSLYQMSNYFTRCCLQSWPKRFVIGCVISPLSQQAESRNLGHTFLANSVSSNQGAMV